MPSKSYRGRFAPSPTGQLHLGSIVAAVASYADARHVEGTWLLRIEDVDQTRTRAGAERDILRDLNRLGMHWDEAPTRQSDREDRYSAILQHLADTSLAYRCSCSRKTIASLGARGREGPIYPGTCRRRPPDENQSTAWRIALDDETVVFVDRIQGALRQQLTALMATPLPSPTPNYFDENLVDAVTRFQAGEGLLTDGIVGPATWIRLANRLKLPQPSLAG